MAYVEMKIDSARVAKYSDEWLILLKEKDGQRYLPVYVDKNSADILGKVLRGDDSILTQDDDIQQMLAMSEEVALVIDDVNKGIFNAECIMGWQGKASGIKCSIGKILAVCAKTNGHVLVEEGVLDKAGIATPKSR
jgi:bifunctional DNase/RNase